MSNQACLLVFLSFFLLGCLVEGQSQVDTTLTFDFSNTVPKVYNCPNGPPRLPNDTLVEIALGGLFDVTGATVPTGPLMVMATQIAIKELNDLFRAISAPFFVTLSIQDTRGDPTLVLTKLGQLPSGLQVILGPTTSSEIAAIQSYVAANQITVISQSSTSTSLSIPDTIFRMQPPNNIDANVIGLYIIAQKFQNVIVLYRNDNFGEDFASILMATLNAGNIANYPVSYSSSSPNFPQILALAEMTAAPLTGSVAVVLISLGEWVNIFGSIGTNNPALAKAVWIGTELSTNNLTPNVYSQAATTQLLNVAFSVPETDLTDSLVETFRPLLVNPPIPKNAFSSYDAVYTAVLSFLLPRTTSNPLYDQALSTIASQLYLTTQRVDFDENGDRSMDLNYNVYKLIGTNFVTVSYYDSNTGQFTNANLGRSLRQKGRKNVKK